MVDFLPQVSFHVWLGLILEVVCLQLEAKSFKGLVQKKYTNICNCVLK